MFAPVIMGLCFTTIAQKDYFKRIEGGKPYLFLVTAIGASSFFSYIIHVIFLHYKKAVEGGPIISSLSSLPP